MENLKKEIQKVVNLYELHKFSEAELLGKIILKRKPKISFLLNLLGLLCEAQKKTDEAIDYYYKGIAIEPNNALIYNNLATAYKAKKIFSKSENYYKKSISINSKLPEAHNNLGNLYIQLNKPNEAIDSFTKSIKANSKFYVAHYNLGILYKSIGKFKSSCKHLSEATNLYERFYSAHRAYSQIYKYKKYNDRHIQTMIKLYNEKNINIIGKAEIAFALGKAFDDIKKFDKAFLYFKEGNNLRRNEVDFSIDNEKAEFINIKKIFNKIFINKYQNINNKDSTPMFILGMPRSGTTLVEQIVSSHPDIYGGDELNYFNDLIKENFYEDNVLSINEHNNNVNEKLKAIYSLYLESIRKLSTSSLRITDKLPINFKWIGFIKLIFPNAKIIHCIRNPKDICISIYKNYFTNRDLNYAYNLDELVFFYNIYDDLMKFWKKQFPESIIEIEYEKLIENPNIEIKKIIKKSDLDWNPECLKYYNNKRTIKTASDTQARSKIYKKSKDSWKNYEKYLKRYLIKLNN
tara:strand:+ start:330 stop:1886 length:1557 start_codon:yes stop_codon:yes gene_type:complete